MIEPEFPETVSPLVVVASVDDTLVGAVTESTTRMSCQVASASSVDDAFAMARDRRASVILVDEACAGSPTASLCEKLSKISNFPIIFLSAHDERGAVHDTYVSDVFVLLAKPVESVVLGHVIQSALEHYRRLVPQIDGVDKMLEPERARSIHIATGLLMERFGIVEKDAYGRLRQQARNLRVKLPDFANRLIDASETSNQLYGEMSRPTNLKPASRTRPANFLTTKRKV